MENEKNYQVSSETAVLIDALHNSGAKFYTQAYNAIAEHYTESSKVCKDFAECWERISDVLERCILTSIAEHVECGKGDTI